MKRKVLVFLFFVVVFLLPVAWYLFLQIFGENKFDLPKIELWDQYCAEVNRASLVIDSEKFAGLPNELKRISDRVKGQPVIQQLEFDSEVCNTRFAFYLIDEDGWVRGKFEASREEVDRLMAEIDIYLLNKQNESGN